MYNFTNIIINMNNNINNNINNINNPIYTNAKHRTPKMIYKRDIKLHEHVLWKPYKSVMYKDYVVVAVIQKNENDVIYCITPNDNFELPIGVKDVYKNVYVTRDELV